MQKKKSQRVLLPGNSIPDSTWIFDPKEVADMPRVRQELFEKSAFLSKVSGKWVYSIDDSRFCNHSSKKNNIDFIYSGNEPEGYGIANRDIEAGEELLTNYEQFDEWEKTSNSPYLNS